MDSCVISIVPLHNFQHNYCERRESQWIYSDTINSHTENGRRYPCYAIKRTQEKPMTGQIFKSHIYFFSHFLILLLILDSLTFVIHYKTW